MINQITLSKDSQKWINLLSKNDNFLSNWKGAPTTIQCTDLIIWLREDIEYPNKQRFWLESLRTSLLKDLNESFIPHRKKANLPETISKGWFAKVQVGVFAVAGTILAICQGFDTASPVLDLFIAAPAALLFVLGLAFSTLSLVVFYGFDLTVISNNLGVKLHRSPQLIHVLLEQVEQIKLLRKKIERSYLENKNINELICFQEWLQTLFHRYNALDEAREMYRNLLNSPSLKMAKAITAVLTGVLFFTSGFFSGQTIALMVSGLFATAISVTFWPIMLTSIFVGMTAFSIYWFVERPGLQNLVGHWFGLDQEHINALADEAVVYKQKQKFDFLASRMEHQIESLQELDHLHATIHRFTLLNGLARPDSASVVQSTDAARTQPIINPTSSVVPNEWLSQDTDALPEIPTV